MKIFEIMLLVLCVALALGGLCATAVAIFHPSPGQTRVIRILAWPAIKPSNDIALPLGVSMFSFGTLFGLISLPAQPPLWLLISLVFLMVVSGLVLGLRREEV